jgi:hypothetical protein
MTKLTVFGAAILGTTLVAGTAALACCRESESEVSLQGPSNPSHRSDHSVDDDTFHQRVNHGRPDEPDSCEYPNYYGLYPNYYVGADGRGHFCESWDANLSR